MLLRIKIFVGKQNLQYKKLLKIMSVDRQKLVSNSSGFASAVLKYT
jgi:hypothetical protein